MSGLGGPDRHGPFPFEALRDSWPLQNLNVRDMWSNGYGYRLRPWHGHFLFG